MVVALGFPGLSARTLWGSVLHGDTHGGYVRKGRQAVHVKRSQSQGIVVCYAHSLTMYH